MEGQRKESFPEQVMCYIGKKDTCGATWERHEIIYLGSGSGLFLVGPELSQSKHTSFWESGELDLGCPGSRLRCA